MSIRVGIVGYGKIARDQHAPAIAGHADFTLAAVSTRSGDPDLGAPFFEDALDMIARHDGALDAVAICTPPQARRAVAKAALEAGLAVLLEKPPAATLGEIEDLERCARANGAALFAAWHSQHAPAVAEAAALLEGAPIARLEVSWFEDVRKWHPGQEWIWEPGGFGVFDPGINALSILSAILPERLFVRDARLLTPANKQAPIAAEIAFTGVDRRASFDWRFTEGERWTILIETAAGRRIELLDGGARLRVDGAERPVSSRGEYPALYDRFAGIVRDRAVEVDREPLRIVADALLLARRETAEPFT